MAKAEEYDGDRRELDRELVEDFFEAAGDEGDHEGENHGCHAQDQERVGQPVANALAERCGIAVLLDQFGQGRAELAGRQRPPEPGR